MLLFLAMTSLIGAFISRYFYSFSPPHIDRSGETVRLVDLLDEAKIRMAKVLTERVESGQSPLPKEDIDMAAEAIGYGELHWH
jgi:hypothetical protein